jgi:hypothetical protein
MSSKKTADMIGINRNKVEAVRYIETHATEETKVADCSCIVNPPR